MNRIKDLRIEKNILQKDLASHLKVTPNTVYNYETGRIDIPSASLVKICKFFNVSTDYLLGISDQEQTAVSTLGKYDIQREFNKLNNDSKEKLIFYLDLLLSNQK